MRIQYLGKRYDVCLEDDDTMNTVISVDGKEYRFNECSWARRPDGSFYLTRFRLLAEQAVELYQEDEEIKEFIDSAN